MAAFNYLTKEGYEKLKAEMDDLKSRGRDEAARAIAEAREKGDLSENAEYDAAKDAQGMLELRINELEKALANARILDGSHLDESKVTVLSSVTIRNIKTNKEMAYKLVSESEADLKTGRLSVSSPMGQGLLGKTIGDIAVVETPRGNIEFEIVKISAEL
jgi:transcription elongation factor GreA